MLKATADKLKAFFRKFFLIDDTPHKVAAGAALGIFLGIVPGEGLVMTLIVATLLHLNRLSATAGVLATNMWATVLTLPPAAWVGGLISGENGTALIDQFQHSYHLGWKYFLSKAVLLDIALPLVIGFLIVAGIIALGFYFLLLYLLKRHRISLT